MSRGFSRVAPPRLYLATEPYAALLGRLRANMDRWGLDEPVGLVAGMDADQEIGLRPGVVNVVIGHSVLHHVLDYRACIRRLAGLLDRPGVLLVYEPIKDGWAHHLSLIPTSCFWPGRRVRSFVAFGDGPPLAALHAGEPFESVQQ